MIINFRPKIKYMGHSGEQFNYVIAINLYWCEYLALGNLTWALVRVRNRHFGVMLF